MVWSASCRKKGIQRKRQRQNGKIHGTPRAFHVFYLERDKMPGRQEEETDSIRHERYKTQTVQDTNGTRHARYKTRTAQDTAVKCPNLTISCPLVVFNLSLPSVCSVPLHCLHCFNVSCTLRFAHMFVCTTGSRLAVV